MDIDADMDAILAEIHKKHGLNFTRDDPVMVIATLNKILVHEFLKALRQAIMEHQSEMESAMMRNNKSINDASKHMLQEAKSQVQNIINQTLSSSKDALQKAIAQAVKTKTADIKEELEQSIERARLAANTALIAACAAIFAAGLALWASL